jgi:hypothetical protein
MDKGKKQEIIDKAEYEKREHKVISKTRFYKIWKNIKSRCLNKNTPNYERYGGRGITVHSSWMKFKNFYNDMYDSYNDGLSIERIDNNKGYSKDNCKWIPLGNQQRNTRRTMFLTFKGETLARCEWAKRLNTSSNCLRERIKKGWSDKKVLSTPIKPYRL